MGWQEDGYCYCWNVDYGCENCEENCTKNDGCEDGTPPANCGNQNCDPGECSNCAYDCEITDCCGNGTCDVLVGENNTNCPQDNCSASYPTGPIDLELNYPTFGGFNLNENQDLNQIVAWFYYFIVTIAGFAAFVMLVWGGFEWLTSAGSPTRTGNAKDRITSALIGLLIILGSYLILQIINPDLLILNMPSF